jgi:hypothetical protein
MEAAWETLSSLTAAGKASTRETSAATSSERSTSIHHAEQDFGVDSTSHTSTAAPKHLRRIN